MDDPLYIDCIYIYFTQIAIQISEQKWACAVCWGGEAAKTNLKID